MRYGYFVSYNVVVGLVWTVLFLALGYFFGNLPVVKDNFSLVIIAIIVISFIPPVYEFIKGKTARPKQPVEKADITG
jgi:membrane-associated protein